MRKFFLAGALLLVTMVAPAARGQDQQHPPRFQVTSTDLAITYSTEQASVTPPGAAKFWMQGASLDGAFTFYRGLGLASNLTGDYAPHIAPGVGAGTLTFMIGPRYTYRLRTGSKHETRVFAEALAGGARGFGGEFPTATGLKHRAASFCWETGGGADFGLTKRVAIRAEADFVRTYLPNNALNKQGDLRMALGVTYHVGKH